MKTKTSADKENSPKIVLDLCNFTKKHKRMLICVSVALFLCLAMIIVVSVVRDKQAQELQKAQIGKCYKETTYDSWSGRSVNIYYFMENGYTNLNVDYEYGKDGMVEYVWGSLDKASSYECFFEISFFGEPRRYGNLIKLNEANEIVECGGNSWERISLEEALEFEKESRKLWAQKSCDHEYGNLIVAEEATCSKGGKETKTCKKCDYVWVNETDKLPHNFVNKICSVCGEEWVPEKADLKPNAWYTYDGGPLNVQNCLVVSALSVSQGKAMTVQYYAVCSHCHVIDDCSQLAGPEVNYEVKRIYTCNECGGQTLVRLKIG